MEKDVSVQDIDYNSKYIHFFLVSGIPIYIIFKMRSLGIFSNSMKIKSDLYITLG